MELNAVDFIKTLGVTFAALFPIVNPLGGNRAREKIQG
jgi:hypothetical protein